MIRLRPMSQSEFEASVERTIVRRAENSVRRGLWTEAAALEASRLTSADVLREGLTATGHSYCQIIESENNTLVGETWFVQRDDGGIPTIWVDWLWIDPALRRRGYATQVLHELARRAGELGAGNIGLDVYADNPEAAALYAKLGYVPLATSLILRLRPPP
jgi:RimJ/RimL family protein N-acetyltransferase